MSDGRERLARRLRACRQASGRSLEDIERETRVPQRALWALERGAFDELPDGPVAKGFAIAYARAVGVCPSEIHAHWPDAPAGWIPPRRASTPASWRWVVFLLLLLIPLFFLARWLAAESRSLGQTGQAWASDSPNTPPAATLRT